MLALALCLAAFLVTYFSGKRSLTVGILSVLAIGDFYGLIRANVISPYSHFIFDASVLGLYLALPWRRVFADRSLSTLRMWVALLTTWPLLMFFLPTQPLLIQLVGLRGHTFFIPCLLIGGLLTSNDVLVLSCGMAVLNIIAAIFGVAEYFLGVPYFYPPSPVTLLIYLSGDVAGGFFRIPAIFTNAHAYAGNMVASLPFLIGSFTVSSGSKRVRALAVIGALAAVSGVLMASTRLYFIVCSALLIFAAVKSGSTKARALVLLVISAAGYMAITNPRFQRFKSLDAESVAGRVNGSVNRTFVEVIVEYPLGNGLGGAGTSLPHFLADLVRRPVSIENEYARIALEQGLLGLLFWIGFIAWCITRRSPFRPNEWKQTRIMSWWLMVWGFATSCLGTGMLTAIPATFTFLLTVGWLVTQTTRGLSGARWGTAHPLYKGQHAGVSATTVRLSEPCCRPLTL